MLFAKLNADATARILEKLNRVRSIEGSGDRLDLPRPNFFVPASASLTFDWARKTIYPFQGADDTDQEIQQKNVRIMFSLFLDSTAVDNDGQNGWSVEDLSLMVQLAGFHRRFWYLTSTDYVTNGSESPSWSIFSDVACSAVKQQASQFGPMTAFKLDKFGRSPFHYAAEHRLLEMVSTMLQFSSDPFHEIVPACGSSDADSYPISPLALAVYSGNKAMVDMMLSSGRLNTPDVSDQPKLLPPRVARTAVEAGNFDILKSIVEFGTDINEADDRGQLLLCTATRRMPHACGFLLKHGANVNLVEPSSGRTAFCLASIRGDTSLVQLLLEYGADPNIPDSRGWLPIEHAAYRGYFKILLPLGSMDGYDASANMAGAGPIATAPIAQTDRSASSHIPWIHDSGDISSRNCVWIRLGNNDATKPLKGLHLHDPRSSKEALSPADEVLYTISVSVQGDLQTRREWTLPILESSVNKPWLFYANSIDDLRLLWQLFTYSAEEPNERKLVGSGIALMGSLNRGSRQNRESVVRDTTVPLLAPETSSYVGSITFTYFWSKPHPTPTPLREPRYWEFGNGIGGHRGSGKNMIGNKKLQIGENTAQSFSTAISHGASFLEFDVQLTKDLVPVVYHDFLISETGTDSTMHTLTYEQLKHISSTQGPQPPRGSRSNSLETADRGHLDAFRERMNYTHFNKINGFKANTRGSFIHEETCSLEEVLHQVPASVPLNIELKYPMLFETEEWDMELLAIKTDIFVDTILDKVYEHAEGRTIVFSSFNPEICIALSTKQRTFPVFFISKTAAPRGEVRSSCIQQAVHFAKSWGLRGVVVECTPFVNCPRLLEYVKSAGLAVMTFGLGNSDKSKVKVPFHSDARLTKADS